MTYYLDTETTGLYRSEGAELVEVAVLREDGVICENTLIKPTKPIPSRATAVHGITDKMVAHAPSIRDVRKKLYTLLEGQTVVIYNAEFDLQWFNGLKQIADVRCCMLRYAEFYGDYDDYHGDHRWVKLTTAAQQVGCVLPPYLTPHRALADCYMTRAVWNYMERSRTREKGLQGPSQGLDV